MNIAFVEIKNFRKLKSCRIDLSPKSTIFVGANNSGKTSAMFALMKFLKRKPLLLDDFTVSNLVAIQQLGEKYIDDTTPFTPQINDWVEICPFIDVWLEVREDELRYVADIIPTLTWRNGKIGIRLIFEPRDVEKIYQGYVDAYKLARERSGKANLWPVNFIDFLQQKLNSLFTINAYILDDQKLVIPSEDNVAHPQETPYNTSPLDFDPFKKLIRVDIISAQRWLEDSDGDNGEFKSETNLLSNQLRDYYDRQLDPERKPSPSDIKALNELQAAKDVFDKQISKRFKSAMDELSVFGYPGKFNPGIIIESKTQTSDIISHNTVVKYPIFSDGTNEYKLPEKFNGLGYQNLISMSFKLMSFRDSWINGDRRKLDDEEVDTIPPIHLVLLEEPEAHLHVQVQQVFIKNAYKILRNNSILYQEKNDDLSIESLNKLNNDIESIISCWRDDDPTCRELLNVVFDNDIFPLHKDLKQLLEHFPSEDDVDYNKISNLNLALNAKFSEVERYFSYVLGNANFDTHQGVKGLEFDRVMVIIDDNSAHGSTFNYNKLFGLEEKSDTDIRNEREGKETTLDRTRRLLYVTCSRAINSLAIVYYTSTIEAAYQAILETGWFKENEIIKL